LDVMAGAGRGIIGSARSVLLPVSSFFVHEDDDALFDEEANGRKPIMLTEEMRREIEEKVRKEKEREDRRKQERKGSIGGELNSSGGGTGGKRRKGRSGDYQGISVDDGDGVEMQEREEKKDAGMVHDDDGL